MPVQTRSRDQHVYIIMYSILKIDEQNRRVPLEVLRSPYSSLLQQQCLFLFIHHQHHHQHRRHHRRHHRHYHSHRHRHEQHDSFTRQLHENMPSLDCPCNSSESESAGAGRVLELPSNQKLCGQPVEMDMSLGQCRFCAPSLLSLPFWHSGLLCVQGP